ncbi:MAG TPA: formate dehydrogenase accessory protein FdhE [Magnetospirillum sp.]|jgi:FdhE protein|nr:formate dehydrogenase accessory protein FdhE [Magnetospirillum sp.]
MSHSLTDLDAAIAEAGLVPGQSPSPVLLPDASTVFAKRAARLREIAPGNGLAEWLSFVAILADAQHTVIGTAAQHQPEHQWLADLRALLAVVVPLVPATVRGVVEALEQSDNAALAECRERIHAGHARRDDLAAAPFLAAAEQVAWTRHAATLDAATTTPSAVSHQCPVCGQPPVAGMIHIGAASAGLRYLHCGTCGCAWHHVRATCVACGDSRELGYQMIEGGDQGIRAECCDHCHSTLKLFLLDKNPGFDPVADDLASIALDILVGEKGYQRIGGNPFLAMAAED